MFWVFSLMYFLFFFFSLSGLWNEWPNTVTEERMQSCTNVDAFSKVRHTSTGFPKRCDRILISDKDIFKTHLREVYIMMILCNTEIKTYVPLKKGQTAAARKKKWDFLDFPVGLPNLRGRKSGTPWVWKLMEALYALEVPHWGASNE